MKATPLKRVQLLRTDMKTAWDFFSSPLKLAEITPDWLDFEVVSDVPEKMYEGLILQYNVHPFLSIPIGWTTEITHIKEPFFFVDEQRAGPYRMWHHEHHFRETENGVEMTDLVHYILPLQPFSTFFMGSIVKKKLNDIFSYRTSVLNNIFNNNKQ